MTPCSSMSPSSSGFRHAEYCSHSALPQRDRLFGGFELAVGGRLRLAGVAARELGVQVGDLVAHHFGDGRALARREVGRRQRAQLTAHRFVERRDRRDAAATSPSAWRRRRRRTPATARVREGRGLGGPVVLGSGVLHRCAPPPHERGLKATYSTKRRPAHRPGPGSGGRTAARRPPDGMFRSPMQRKFRPPGRPRRLDCSDASVRA